MRPLYFISLALILLAGVLFFVLRNNDPFGKENSKFNIDWTDKVDRVSIREDGKELVLNRTIDGWKVNDKLEARESAISFILKTLANLEIKSPVTEESFDALVGKQNIKATEVRIFGEGSLEFSFLIYKDQQQGTNSILKRKEATKPYYVDIPGYNTDPGSHFVCDERFWVPYNIFKLHPQSIASINLDYKDPSMGDIEIEVNNGDLSLKLDNKPAPDADPERIRRYISYFTFIPFESWDFNLDEEIKKKVLASDPEMIFLVKILGGQSISVKLWIRQIMSDNMLAPDTDRLYGEINNGGELFIVKYFDIDPLIKSSEYFVKD
ncbi:MAG: hypothetical protein QNK33_10345 [Bacteroidales bacterium]|nr:hypothetical protein [Bacteroidales bacterium]